MEAILSALIYLSAPSVIVTSVCDRSIEHLSMQKKVEIYIGCSTVDGRKVYNDMKLERIYSE